MICMSCYQFTVLLKLLTGWIYVSVHLKKLQNLSWSNHVYQIYGLQNSHPYLVKSVKAYGNLMTEIICNQISHQIDPNLDTNLFE